MIASLMTALLLGTAPAPAGSVQAGKADWKSFPALQRAARPLPTGAMVDRVADMLQKEQCALPGQSARKFDITIPYVVLVNPDGKAERVVVEDIGCPGLETYVGSIVLLLAGSGDFPPTGKSVPQWYTSTLNFNAR